MRILCLLFLLWPCSLFAQPIHRTAKGWQELTLSDGLSQGMIYDIKQDQKGFIWIATKDGLNRYDGYNFTVFTHDPYDAYSVSANACTVMLVDSQGRLWVGTLNKGLNLYNDRTQRFYHIDMSDPASPDAGNDEIIMLSEDPEGNIWAGTGQNKLVKITLSDSLKTGFPGQANATGQVTFNRFAFPLLGASSNSTPAHISFRTDGQAMVSAARGGYLLNWRHPDRFTRLPQLGTLASLVRVVPPGKQPDYWFGFSADTLIGWHRNRRKVIKMPPIKNYSIFLGAFNTNTIAVATVDFLWLMSPDQLFAQDSLSARNSFAVMPPNLFGVTKLLIDRTGNIWLGTAGYGLRKFSSRIRQFQAYLPNTSLTYLFQDRQGKTYVRDQYDYGRLDRSANRRVPLLKQNRPDSRILLNYLMQDHNGFFWASASISSVDSQHHQLMKFSEDWKPLNTYPLPSGSAFGIYANQSREDKSGMLWIGATNGKLLRFDPATETFQVFSYQSLLPKRGADVETYTVYFDRTGTGWIGTQAGLIRIGHPQKTPAFSIYKNNIADRASLSNDFVSSIIDDPDRPDKYLWISTKGGGLERLDKQTGRFTHYTEAQGLPNKVVYGILIDEFKNLWMSTNRGLAQFNPRTGKFRNYAKGDGLQDDEFNTGSFLKTASGELLFGGVNGLTAFRPRDLTAADGPAPPVHIIGLKINNQTVAVGAPDGILPESIEQTHRLDLSHTQNLLTLEFSVMDYANPAKNQYRYRLDGIDQNWVEAGTNRFANYAQLPSGQYTFEVMGSASGEVWSKPVQLIVRIHPPFYRTWWAYLFYALLVAVVGWQLYRFQKQRLLLQQQVDFEQKEAGRLAELDALKTNFFTNISHEFRTPLTLILGPLSDLKRRFRTENVVTLSEPVVTLMERNGNRLLSLINQLLDLSKLEAGQLKPEPELGNIAAFFRTLASSFTSLAESRGIQFSFTQTADEWWTAFDHDQIEKIVTNLLANAFKFTPSGQHVRMRVGYAVPGVQIVIEDTGIGIAPDQLPHIFERFYQLPADTTNGQLSRTYEGTGIGLALVQELVRVLGGQVNVTSTLGAGTTFTVSLPLVNVAKPTGNPQRVGRETAPLTRSDQVLPASSAESTLPTETSLPTTDKILLIIDDNADIRAYVRSVLKADYQIIEAVDGQQGLERVTETVPDVVICDLMMPRLDGFGFCKALKTQEATSHIPVVMLTAKATTQDRIEGFDLGADDYLTKPFNADELRVRVRNLLQKQARLQQYYSSGLVRMSRVAVEPPPYSEKEEAFLSKARRIVAQHIGESNFGVEQFSEQMSVSQSQMVRKLKALTGQTAVEFIRNFRLEQASEKLRRGEGSVSEVAYGVGFESLSYFTRAFQEKFGVLPSALIPGGATQGAIDKDDTV